MSDLPTIYKQFIISCKAMNSAFDELFPEGHAFTGNIKVTQPTMSPKTLAALKASIAKWEGIVAGTAIDVGADNCALCQAFKDPYCEGCPVRETVHNWGCQDTPYIKWNRLTRHKGYIRKAETPKELAAAQAELDFLKSLLPKEQS